MQGASTNLVQSDQVMLVCAGATQHTTSLEPLQSSYSLCFSLQTQLPPRNERTGVCCLTMCHDTSHLHGGCFVSLLTMDSAAAGLSTSMATIPHRHRVFEIVPRLRDRLAVCFVTPTTFTNPEHGMAGRRSTACCVACSTPLTTWSILAGLRLPCLANLSDTAL